MRAKKSKCFFTYMHRPFSLSPLNFFIFVIFSLLTCEIKDEAQSFSNCLMQCFIFLHLTGPIKGPVPNCCRTHPNLYYYISKIHQICLLSQCTEEQIFKIILYINKRTKFVYINKFCILILSS